MARNPTAFDANPLPASTVLNVNKWLDESRFSGFHWLLFLLCICIITFDGYDLVIYGAAIPILLKEFRINPAEAGVIGSYALIGAALGALIFGSLADKIGRKVAIIIAAAVFSIATGLTGLTHGPRTFGLCRFCAGLGIGGAMPNVVALASEYAPVKNRALMIAAIFSGMQIGGMAAAGFGIWLFPLFGWRSVFYLGALPLLLIPVLIKILPESPLRLIATDRIRELKATLERVRPEEPLPDGVAFEINKGSGRAPIVDLFRDNRGFSTVLIWIVFFMNLYMIFGLGIWLPKLMMNAGFPLGSGLVFLLILQVAPLVGSPIAGVIADRVGAKPTLVVCFLMAFASIALLSQTRSFPLLIALVAMAGIGFFSGQNVANSYVSLFYPPAMRSTAMGFAFGLGRMGAIFGPAIAGILMYMKLSLFVDFMGLAVPGLIAAVAIFLIQNKYSFSTR